MGGEIAQLKEEIEMLRQEKLGLGSLLRELQSRKEKLDFKYKKQVLGHWHQIRTALGITCVQN
ncbi:hypothetical protein JHK87_009391 [Glycine soja]|nr:hypothetical protein JHK87_009391 [Glycine soja]